MNDKAMPGPHTPTAWERFRGGFLQAWFDNRPNYSWWGRAQGYIVAAALGGIVLMLAGIAVLLAIS